MQEMITAEQALWKAVADREEVIQSALNSAAIEINTYATRAVINGKWLAPLSHELVKNLDDYGCKQEFQRQFIELARINGWDVAFENLQHCFKFSPRKAPCA